MPRELLFSLQAKFGKRVNIRSAIVEKQRYNSCGPEVVENFVSLLTSNRLKQEETVPFHSKLVESDLTTTVQTYLNSVTVDRAYNFSYFSQKICIQ